MRHRERENDFLIKKYAIKDFYYNYNDNP